MLVLLALAFAGSHNDAWAAKSRMKRSFGLDAVGGELAAAPAPAPAAARSAHGNVPVAAPQPPPLPLEPNSTLDHVMVFATARWSPACGR